MSKSKKIAIAFFVILIVATIALYVCEIAFNGTPPTQRLAKALAIVIGGIAGIAKVLSGPSRKNLKFYESQYSEEIKNAFSGSSFDRNKLLCALRLYDEGNLGKAAKYLISLQPKCNKEDDYSAVGLFLALTFTEMKLYNEAVNVYLSLIKMGITSSRIYSNLGNVYSYMGNYDDAISYLRLAIQNDPENPYACNNLASLYFDVANFDNAIKYAEEALRINHKLHQSASLLAIIYAIKEDTESSARYYHMAISAGESPERLKNAIEHFKTAENENGSEDESEGY